MYSNKERFLNLGYTQKDMVAPYHNHRYFRAAFMMANGHPCDEKDFDTAFKHIHYRFDCCDFVVLLLLRLYYLYAEKDLMGEELKKQLKEEFLDFDYWLSENYKFPSSKIIWTENHIMCYHSAEYLAAQLFPNEHFRSRGMTGREVLAKSKAQILDWIVMKGKVGFSEWDSNSYAAINVESLLAVYDFAEDPEIQKQAGNLLNVIFLSLACNTYRGMYCCSHGRVYTPSICDGQQSEVYPLFCMAWNVGEIPEDCCFKGSAFSFATSSFEPKPIITSIYRAVVNREEFENREQQSFDVEDGPMFGKGFDSEEDLVLYWHNMGYSHRLVVKNMRILEDKYHISVNDRPYLDWLHFKRCEKEGIESDVCYNSTYMPRVNKIVYRTRDYMLSTAQDFRKSKRGFQQHIWQASLDMRAVIFVNHPGALTIGQSRPDFWAGNWTMPRAAQYKNVCISIYRIEDEYALPFTHAYVPQDEFDEVTECGNWIFLRKGNGYCGLYSLHGYAWSTRKDMARCELVCEKRENIWICEMGSSKEYGSFTMFVSSILARSQTFGQHSVCYECIDGELFLGWEGQFTLNGMEIPLSHYKRFDNIYCKSDYNSGVYELRCGEEESNINFV